MFVAENSRIPLILNFPSDEERERGGGFAVWRGTTGHVGPPMLDR
jgi:hypothetical protein